MKGSSQQTGRHPRLPVLYLLKDVTVSQDKKRYADCQRQGFTALIEMNESNMESEVKMSKVKFLKLSSFVLMGLVQLILQTQAKNVFQMSMAELGLMAPWVSQFLPMDQLTEILQDVFVDSAVNRLMTSLGLMVSFWVTFQNRKSGSSR